jgi:hypothetical protein
MVERQVQRRVAQSTPDYSRMAAALAAEVQALPGDTPLAVAQVWATLALVEAVTEMATKVTALTDQVREDSLNLVTVLGTELRQAIDGIGS